jgi:hypothetical protein
MRARDPKRKSLSDGLPAFRLDHRNGLRRREVLDKGLGSFRSALPSAQCFVPNTLREISSLSA